MGIAWKRRGRSVRRDNPQRIFCGTNHGPSWRAFWWDLPHASALKLMFTNELTSVGTPWLLMGVFPLLAALTHGWQSPELLLESGEVNSWRLQNMQQFLTPSTAVHDNIRLELAGKKLFPGNFSMENAIQLKSRLPIRVCCCQWSFASVFFKKDLFWLVWSVVFGPCWSEMAWFSVLSVFS